jgi:hypothetical protein
MEVVSMVLMLQVILLLGMPYLVGRTGRETVGMPTKLQARIKALL